MGVSVQREGAEEGWKWGRGRRDSRAAGRTAPSVVARALEVDAAAVAAAAIGAARQLARLANPAVMA